jgi:hypothetical protein
MGESDDKKLGRYEGPTASALYPLSRMAPSFDLVNAAREIQRADAMLATMTGGKLEIIAEQIRALKAQAEAILEKARLDAELHRVRCNFEKRVGQVYHLYRRPDGELWFSLIAPSEWITKRDHTFEGSFRLDADMGFTRVA